MKFVRLTLVLIVFPSILSPSLFGQLVGQGEFSKVAGAYVPEYLPKVDIRQFFATPYPTQTQAQMDDFGADLNAAFLFAGSQGGCDKSQRLKIYEQLTGAEWHWVMDSGTTYADELRRSSQSG
jgi:hypothetical protein